MTAEQLLAKVPTAGSVIAVSAATP
jgi:hypothetical protein